MYLDNVCGYFVNIVKFWMYFVRDVDLEILCLQIGQSHPTGLTTNLLKLFEPRPPLDFKPPPEKKKCPPLTGLLTILYGD